MEKTQLLSILKNDYLLSLHYCECLEKAHGSAIEQFMNPPTLLRVYGLTTHQYLFLCSRYYDAAANYKLLVDNYVTNLLLVELTFVAGTTRLVSPLDYFKRIRSISRSLVASLYADNDPADYAPYALPLPPSLTE